MGNQFVAWVVCKEGTGRQILDNGEPDTLMSSYPKDAVGVLSKSAESQNGDFQSVWLIGCNQNWLIPNERIEKIDIESFSYSNKSRDKIGLKICNICHCLKSVEAFAANQTGKNNRVVRRPTCIKCRTDIDKREPKTQQAKQKELERPQTGEIFQCPICRKRSIADVTAKLVADHDHDSGNIRAFLCESCNTGLGRFKDSISIVENAKQYLQQFDVFE